MQATAHTTSDEKSIAKQNRKCKALLYSTVGVMGPLVVFSRASLLGADQKHDRDGTLGASRS